MSYGCLCADTVAAKLAHAHILPGNTSCCLALHCGKLSSALSEAQVSNRDFVVLTSNQIVFV